jgi:hypothetical protein
MQREDGKSKQMWVVVGSEWDDADVFSAKNKVQPGGGQVRGDIDIRVLARIVFILCLAHSS